MLRLILLLTALPMVATAQPLVEVLEKAEDLDPLHSLLISYQGEVVAEQYYRGMTADSSVNVKSVSKSMLSAVVGIALRDSLLAGTHQRIDALLPDYFADSTAKEDVYTLHHVLSMTTGLEGTSFSNYGTWVNSPDWVRFALDQPSLCPPSTCMTYSTGNSHLISVMLSQLSDSDMLTYAQSALFDALGIELILKDLDPQGFYLGGNNFEIRPHDMLAFGEMYRNDGRHNGKQLVPKDWISRSWTPYTVSPWNGHQYGYFWWSNIFGGEQTYFAWGYGGQYIFIIPNLELVVVVTSALENRPVNGDHNGHIIDLLEYDIIPAIQQLRPAVADETG